MRRTYSVMSSIDISLLPFAYLWLTLTSTSLMKGARPPLLLLRFKKNDDDDEKWKALSGYFSKSVIYSSIYARVSLVNKRPCFSLFSVKSTIQIKIVFMRPCVYFPKFNEDIFYTFRNIHIDGLQMLYTYFFSYWLTLLFWHVRYTMLCSWTILLKAYLHFRHCLRQFCLTFLPFRPLLLQLRLLLKHFPLPQMFPQHLPQVTTHRLLQNLIPHLFFFATLLHFRLDKRFLHTAKIYWRSWIFFIILKKLVWSCMDVLYTWSRQRLLRGRRFLGRGCFLGSGSCWSRSSIFRACNIRSFSFECPNDKIRFPQ